MTVVVMAFGIIKEIFDNNSIEAQLPEDATVETLQHLLEAQYPQLQQLASYFVAVNEAYAAKNTRLHPLDEIALIPPVSGG